MVFERPNRPRSDVTRHRGSARDEAPASLRAVLDPNILVSALLSRDGAPARVLQAWIQGSYALIVSRLLIIELRRVLTYRKLRKRVDSDVAREYVGWLESTAVMAMDPKDPPSRGAEDPGDNYLIALAESSSAALVSGDNDVLDLRGSGLPIYSAAEFLAVLG